MPPPQKKKWMERRNPLFDFQKTSPTLLEPSTCLEGAINKAAAWWTQSTEGHLLLLTSASSWFFFFFYTLSHTRSSVPEERAVSRRRGRPVKCDRLATPPKQQLQCDHQMTLLREMEEKKNAFVLHRRKQIAVRVSPVVFPVPAAGSCCCLDLLAGEGGVNTRPWMLPLLWKRYQCPL